MIEYKVVKRKSDNELFAIVWDGVQYKHMVPVTFDASQETEIVPNYNQDSPVTVAAFEADFEGTELYYRPK